MATTNNLGITLLEQSQAQKEVTINQAFSVLDAMAAKSVVDKDLTAPPGSPVAGALYIVAASPTGAWTGKATSLAYFDQVWRFITPPVGTRVWVQDESSDYLFNGTAWSLVSYSGGGGGTGDMVKATYDPANIGQQLVGLSATQTLTNKTLTSPTITTPNIVGTATNNNASTGSVGEYVEIPGLSNSLVSGTPKTLASFSLTAGDWDIWGNVVFSPTATTSITILSSASSLINNALPGVPNGGMFALQVQPATVPNLQGIIQVTGMQRVSLVTTTTIYMVAYAVFTASTLTATGYMAARRMR
jgi:hypothetical protein